MNSYFFKRHLILREGACLITHNIMNSSQFLRNLTVSGNGSLHILISVDSSRKDGFGNIKIDSQRYGNDAAEKEDLSENVQKPILTQSSHKNYDD